MRKESHESITAELCKLNPRCAVLRVHVGLCAGFEKTDLVESANLVVRITSKIKWASKSIHVEPDNLIQVKIL